MTFLFYRLLLGHMIGDFVLQFDWIYELKNRGSGGLLLHAGIVALASAAVLAPQLSLGLLGLLTALGLVHMGLDQLKLYAPWYPKGAAGFVLDQLAHGATLVAAAWLGEGLVRPLGGPGGWPGAGGGEGTGGAGGALPWLMLLYQNDRLTLFLSGAVFVTYALGFLLEVAAEEPPAGRTGGDGAGDPEPEPRGQRPSEDTSRNPRASRRAADRWLRLAPFTLAWLAASGGLPLWLRIACGVAAVGVLARSRRVPGGSAAALLGLLLGWLPL